MIDDAYKRVVAKINDKIKQNGASYDTLDDLLSVSSELVSRYPNDTDYAFKLTNYIKSYSKNLLLDTRDVEYENMYWDAMLLEAPHIFESYMYYTEKDREPARRFYAPRADTLHVVAQDLQNLSERKFKFYGLSMPPRVGKLLADDTPILTTNGWTSHGELKVGDEVYNHEGKAVKVTRVFPKDKANVIITFSNGEKICCHENHEWVVWYVEKYYILSTKKIIEFKEKYPEKFHYLTIIDRKDIEGDPSKTKPNQAYWAGTMCGKYKFKWIDKKFMTASDDERLHFIAGIIDTCGTVRRNRHSYNIYIPTKEKKLIRDVKRLIRTFNNNLLETVVEREGKKYTRLYFSLARIIPCHKLENIMSQTRKYFAPLKIDDIEVLEDNLKTGNCISVEGGIYLAGETLIPTHNSTICIFFLSWMMGRFPNSHSAMGGHSGELALGFHKELLNLIIQPEYNFHKIFPDVTVESKSFDRATLNLNLPDRFPTFTARGLDQSWTGTIDISSDGILYSDDLVKGRTEASNAVTMEKIWGTFKSVMYDRRSDGCLEMMVGTRWGMNDPLGKFESLYGNDPNYFFRKLPALNDNGESNFVYKYGKGFSTAHFNEIKNILDDNEWMAKYMQRPYPKEGIIFPEDSLRYFNGVLPEGDCSFYTACDVAWGGGDSLSMPIGVAYPNGDVYIIDWIHDKGGKEETIPRVIGKILQHKLPRAHFEANNGGAMYAMYISEKLKQQNYACNITSANAPSRMAKMTKIEQYAGDVRKKFIFLDRKLQDREYRQAFDELVTTSSVGRNLHDDACDGIVQLAMQIFEGSFAKIIPIRRPC